MKFWRLICGNSSFNNGKIICIPGLELNYLVKTFAKK